MLNHHFLKEGTLITKKNIRSNKVIREYLLQSDAKITLIGVKDKPGVAASILNLYLKI